MKKWLRKKRKKEIDVPNFVKGDFRELTDPLNNPQRGWYQIFTFDVQEAFDVELWRRILNERAEDACVLLRMDLGAYRECDLENDSLWRIDEILRFFAEQKKDIILRFAYDFEGKGWEKEPNRFSRIKKHVEQLLPVIQKNCQSIYIWQGILLGSWGEMHSSKFLSTDSIRCLETKLESITSLYRAVRKPVFWRMLYSREDFENEVEFNMVGIYDDAILGSDTDLGTYGEGRSENWEESWKTQEELEFLDDLGKYVPIGGEMVHPIHPLTYTLQETIERLGKMHISYLNREYDRKVLENWKALRWDGNDIWKGMNGWDYIDRHMGYRFVIRDISVTEVAQEEIHIRLEISNVGFSVIYAETELILEYENGEGKKEQDMIIFDMRRLHSTSSIKISHLYKKRKGKYFLSMYRKWDKKRIFFANKADAEGRVLLGEIT